MLNQRRCMIQDRSSEPPCQTRDFYILHSFHPFPISNDVVECTPCDEQSLAAKHRTCRYNATVALDIAGHFRKPRIIQTCHHGPSRLEWPPMLQVVVNMSVKLQIVFEEQQVIGG